MLLEAVFLDVGVNHTALREEKRNLSFLGGVGVHLVKFLAVEGLSRLLNRAKISLSWLSELLLDPIQILSLLMDGISHFLNIIILKFSTLQVVRQYLVVFIFRNR